MTYYECKNKQILQNMAISFYKLFLMAFILLYIEGSYIHERLRIF